MEIEFTVRAKQDLEFWKKTNNENVLKRIRELTVAILENQYQGIGKPEALKYKFSGKWSRRINQSDRLIYEIREDVLYILSLKGHYDKH